MINKDEEIRRSSTVGPANSSSSHLQQPARHAAASFLSPRCEDAENSLRRRRSTTQPPPRSSVDFSSAPAVSRDAAAAVKGVVALGLASLGLGPTRVRVRFRVRVPGWKKRRCSWTSSSFCQQPAASIAVKSRETVRCGLAGGVDEPTLVFTSPCDRLNSPTLLPQFLRHSGTSGLASGAHESTLVCVSPADRLPCSHSLDNPNWIACRAIRLVRTNCMSRAFHNI